MPISRVQRVKVSDAVYDQMLEMIRSGAWKTGEKIPSEPELTQRFGVSRVTVREAVQKLVSLSLVESRQGEGTFVCDAKSATFLSAFIPFAMLGGSDIEHILEYRKIMEGGCAELAAQHADAEDIRAMEENLAAMCRHVTDLENNILRDMEFHVLVAKATKNPVVLKAYEIFKDAWLRSLQDIVKTMGSEMAVHYHGEILEAIRRHDPQAAHAAMDEHIVSTIDVMGGYLRQMKAAKAHG